MKKTAMILMSVAGMMLMTAGYAKNYTYTIILKNSTNQTLQATGTGGGVIREIKSGASDTFTRTDDGKTFNVKYNGQAVCEAMFNLTQALDMGIKRFHSTISGQIGPGVYNISCSIS